MIDDDLLVFPESKHNNACVNCLHNSLRLYDPGACLLSDRLVSPSECCDKYAWRCRYKAKIKCSTCNGKGEVEIPMLITYQKETCPDCKGTGVDDSKSLAKCPVCLEEFIKSKDAKIPTCEACVTSDTDTCLVGYDIATAKPVSKDYFKIVNKAKAYVEKNCHKIIEEVGNEIIGESKKYKFTKEDEENFGICARDGEINQLRNFIERGIDINSFAADGWTALQLASYREHIEIVKLLLANGADAFIKNAYNETALDHAVERKNTEIAEMLKFAQIKQNPYKVKFPIRFSDPGGNELTKALDKSIANFPYINYRLPLVPNGTRLFSRPMTIEMPY